MLIALYQKDTSGKDMPQNKIYAAGHLDDLAVSLANKFS